MTAPIDLTTTRLDPGSHAPDSGQHCAMELVSRLAGEPWSDHPACCCPIITAYVIPLHDRMPDDQRQRLLPFIVRLAGSRANREIEQLRAYKAATYAVKVFAPIALDAANLHDHATTLRALPDITDRDSAQTAYAAAESARSAAYDHAAAYAAAYARAAAHAYANAYANAAADAAAYANAAAYAAADAAHSRVWDDALECLDALLAIGVPASDTAPAA